MSRPSPYFMHDQVRHRVARLMRNDAPRPMAASPVWPLIAVIAGLTIINVLTVIPKP